MEQSEKAPSRGIKLFGKNVEPNRNNLAMSWLITIVILPVALVGLYLSFMAISKTLEFYTGFNYILAFIAFLGLGIAISLLKPKNVFRIVNKIMWIGVELLSIYWVFNYSDWSDLKSVAYIITLALSNLSGFMNSRSAD